MKKLLVIALLASCVAISPAQTRWQRQMGAGRTAGNPLNGDPTGGATLRDQQWLYELDREQKASLTAQMQAEYDDQLNSLNALLGHLPSLKEDFNSVTKSDGKGLFRVVNGITNSIYENGWTEIGGKILQTLPDGILVTEYDGLDCFIEGYPFQTVDGQQLPGYFAKEAGIYSFVATSGGRRTVKKYICGIPVIPSATLLQQYIRIRQQQIQQQIENTQNEIENHPLILKAKAAAIARQKQIELRQSAMDRALKSNQDAADKGDAYGLYRMGERYRDGDGVPKDLEKAKDYLQKAVDAGSISAVNELKAIAP